MPRTNNTISPGLAERIRLSSVGYYRDTLGLADWEPRSAQRVDRSYEKTCFKRLHDLIGSVTGLRLLDVGSGWGGVALEATAEAAEVTGIEPDVERLEIARAIKAEFALNNLTLLDAVGEKMPFPDASFDVVVSHQVLEHVQDPAKVVAEIYRVLKPGGVFHCSTPNYMTFWEPHFKVAWLPLFPKFLARIYLRLRGRKTGFLGHLNYVNPPWVHRLLRENGFQFTDLRHQSVCNKVEQKFGRLVTWIPGWRKLVYLTHTCFLNTDQQYFARKP